MIRLRRTGQGTDAEWTVSPLDEPRGYQVTFSLPRHVETWISQHEERRIERTLAVKQQMLSDIVIYRMTGDDLHVYQLRYAPSQLRR
jgi:hypothetical protein